MGNPVGTSKTLTSSDDLDNITTSGIYPFYRERGIPTNVPSDVDRGSLIVFGNEYHPVQIVVGLTSVNVRISAAGNWFDWISL